MSSVPYVEPPARPTVDANDSTTPRGGSGGATRKILLVVFIAAVIAAIIWKIHSNTQAVATTTNRINAAADRPLPVLVVPVQQKTMPIYLTALGTVTPYNAVTIKSRVDGQLMSVNVREGQAVRKGQLLAQIDPRPYEAALAQAQGQLVKDQANAGNANAEAQRYTALYNAGVVSKESQQTQQASAGQAAGSIESDQAAIQAAKVNVAYTRITSPIDGIVGLRQVDPGNIVHASDANGLLLVTQLQPVSVIFTLPEDQLPQVLQLIRSKKQLAVNAYDRSETTQLGTGTLLTLDNEIDPTTGTDKVKAVFANKDGALFPNQFVNVRLILQQRQNALVVPASAIQTGSQGTFVYVVKPGDPPGAKPVAEPVATPADAGGQAGSGGAGYGGAGANAPHFYVVTQLVKVGLTEGTQVIIDSGVNPEDQVVVDGQEKLLNGSKVRPQIQDATRGAGRSAGQGPGAFGPGGAGPSEPASNPGKRGIETGTGVGPGRRGNAGGADTGTPGSGQPHTHHGPPPAGQQP